MSQFNLYLLERQIQKKFDKDEIAKTRVYS